MIEGLGGKLTPGTWIYRFLTIDDRPPIKINCLLGPNLENIFRMDIIGHHITNKDVTIPKTNLAIAKGTSVKLPIPSKITNILQYDLKEGHTQIKEKIQES